MSESKMGAIPWNKGGKMSDKSRKKMSKSSIGKQLSEQTKGKISLSLQNHQVKDEIREKISRNHSKYWAGKNRGPLSIETREKISKTLKNKK